MMRGDIYWCDFEPAIGNEIKKLRPAIIISNDMSNRYIHVVQVIPLTSNITNVYPSECLIETKEKTAKALGSQITTLDKTRVKSQMGAVNANDMIKLEKAILIQLGINV